MQNQDIYPLLLSSENTAGKEQKDYTNQEEGDGILGLTQSLQSLPHSNLLALGLHKTGSVSHQLPIGKRFIGSY